MSFNDDVTVKVQCDGEDCVMTLSFNLWICCPVDYIDGIDKGPTIHMSMAAFKKMLRDAKVRGARKRASTNES